MNASNVLVLLAQTGFVLVAALMGGFLARRSPALRSSIYRVSIVAAIALVIASPWLRERDKPVVPIAWAPPVTQASVTPVANTAKPVAAPAPVQVASHSEEAEIPFEPTSLWAYLPLAWGLVATLFGLHLGLGYLALLRIRRSCGAVVEPRAVGALEDIAKQAGIRAPGLMQGDRIFNPFVAGVLKPTIYLPSGWQDEVDDDTLRALLRHEVAHVTNGDLRWSLFHRLACIALWPQLLLWMLRRPMSTVGEELCDRQVLASGIPVARYAECLLNLRDRSRSQWCPGLGIGAVSSRSFLSRRVEAILDGRASRSVSVPRGLSLVLRMGAVAIAAVGGFLFARPSMSAAAGQDPYANWTHKPYAGKVRLVSPDGRPVSGASAWLVLTGDLPQPISRPLEVKGADVVLSIDKLPERTTGVLVVRAGGLGLGFVRLWPTPTPIVEMRMPPSTGVRGRLSLPDGAPAAGLRLRAQMLVRRSGEASGVAFASIDCIPDLHLDAVTEADGTFLMEGLPPKTTVGYDVMDDRFTPLRLDRRPTTPVSGINEAKPVTLSIAGTISGRVMRDGKPVAGLRVGSQGNTDANPMNVELGGFAVTDADGRYTMKKIGAGSVNVIADLRGALEREVTAVAHEGVVVKSGQNVGGIDFELVPGVIIEGSVSDLSGKPIVETSVGVYGPAHPQSSAWVQGAITDSAGHYRLRVPPGKQYVYVSDSRYQAEAQRIEIAEGSMATVDFQVTAAQPESFDVAMEATEEEQAEEERSREEGKGPVPPVASFGPGRPFYGPVKLANGVTVRLAYVQDEEQEHHLWQPDGGRAAKAYVDGSLDLKDAFRPSPNPRIIFLRVEIDGAPRGTYTCVVEVPHPSQRNVWQSYGDRHDNTVDLASFRAPESLRVTDMRFGVAAGPPTVVPLTLVTVLSKPLTARVKQESVTAVIPPSMEGMDLEVAAYDVNGRSIELRSYETETSKDGSGNRVRTFTFDAYEIARAELLARPYRWATFKGIHLYPNAR